MDHPAGVANETRGSFLFVSRSAQAAKAVSGTEQMGNLSPPTASVATITRIGQPRSVEASGTKKTESNCQP